MGIEMLFGTLIIGIIIGFVLTVKYYAYFPNKIVEQVNIVKEINRFEKEIILLLEGLEKVIYLSPGDSVKKEFILKILTIFSNAVRNKDNNEQSTEGNTFYRHGNNGIESQEEQTIINWARGMEERKDT